MLGFQGLQLAQQAVVLAVRNARIVKDVIAVVGVFDLLAQFGNAAGGALGHVDPALDGAAIPRL
jgi:hypothetical protein